MEWYVARLLFRSIVKGEPSDLAEDTFRLIKARSATEARKKAIKIGKDYEYTYKNDDGDRVRWKMLECIDVCRVEDKLGDGVEIYSLLLVPRELGQIQKMFTLKGGKRWVRPE